MFRISLIKVATFFFVFSLLACNRSSENELPDPFKIIPQPREIELYGERGLHYKELTNVKLDGDFRRPVMGQILSLLIEPGEAETGLLSLRLSTEKDLPGSPEGYVLTIRKGNAEIISRSETGLFYGCQTLEQLLEDSRDFDKIIPACRITDYPELEYRAIHIDVKHHLDHTRVYYEMMDKLARYKINAVIFEFEDKLRYKRQPLVGAPQAISIDEMAALTEYARDRHIEITPLVQGLGHATFILKHDHYVHLRELPDNRWAFCPKDEGTYKVLFDMYRDAMDATPGSRYLHIGGDEVGNIGLCPRCKSYADTRGLMELNLYWLNRVSAFILENGRIPIFWDDMPLKEAGVVHTTGSSSMTREQSDKIWEEGSKKLGEVIEDFPEKCIYMRWNYSMARQPGNIRALEWYHDNGLKVWIATAAQTTWPLFPDESVDTVNNLRANGLPAIQSFIQLAAEKNIDGMLCTAWDDSSPHFETYWRGHIASAEYSWNPFYRSLDEYNLAWLQREFGTTIDNYPALYGKLCEAMRFYGKAFHKNGTRRDRNNALQNLPPAFWQPPGETATKTESDFKELLIELPEQDNPGNWSATYAERLEEAAKIMEEYPQTSEMLNILFSRSLRNRYHWEIFTAINDFQVSVPRLLLAMQQCDTSDQETLKMGKEEVRNALEDFENTWENMKSVFSKTRFISNPDDYLPDRYFQFASQREDLTFHIQVEELFHKMVRDWMGEQ